MTRLRLRALLAGAALGAALLLAPVAARADAAADFAAGAGAFQDGRYDLAVGLYTSVIRSGELRGEALANALYNRGLAYERLGEGAKALADYQVFRTLQPADPDGADRVASVAVGLKLFADARPALEFLMERHPDATLRKRWEIIQVARADQLAGRWAEAEQLLGRYARVDGRDNPVRLARARSAAAMGRKREALDLIRAIDNQYTLVLVRADKGFKSLWNDPEFIVATDLRTHFQRETARLEREVRRSPDRLAPVVGWMGALRRSGALGYAQIIGEDAMALLGQFVDRQDYEVWLHNEVALVALLLGDVAGAERAYRFGIDSLGMTNVDAVNLLLNGGMFLARETTKYRDALDFATQAERLGTSPFGQMIARGIRVAAYAGLNRPAELERAVSDMLRTVSDNAEEVIDALLIAGRNDEAARVVAAQLADPASVDVTLLALQRIVERPPSMRPVGQVVNSGWEGLRGDPRVLAALARVGRITEVFATTAY